MGHARQRGESGGLADLAHARRVAVGHDGAFDGLEDQTLTGSEAEIALTGRTLGNLNLIVITAGGSDLTGNILVARPASDRKSTRLNSSHVAISYAVFCLKKKKQS